MLIITEEGKSSDEDEVAVVFGTIINDDNCCKNKVVIHTVDVIFISIVVRIVWILDKVDIGFRSPKLPELLIRMHRRNKGDGIIILPS